MKSTHRRVVVGLAAAALLAGASFAPTANASVTGSSRELPVRLVVGLRAGVATDVDLPSLSRLGLAGADAKGSMARSLLGEIRAKSIEVPRARAVAVTAALKLDPNVSYVQVDPLAKKLDVAPNDPYFTAGRQPELGQLRVPAAWDTTTGEEVTVAVLDTGVTGTGDLTGKVLSGYDFVNRDGNASDDEGHGTIVSSLIAGTPNNGAGIAGVCAKCKILPVKVLSSTGSGSYSQIAQGIIYAVKRGAKIINMSLGGSQSSAVLQDAVAWANGQGVLVVAAAGNDGSSAKSYPAAYGDVLAVGGTNTRNTSNPGERVEFSNYGSWVDVSAPAITAAMQRNGTYCWDDRSSCWLTIRDSSGNLIYDDYEIQGTSFSSPLVAGVAALVKSKNPNYSGWGLHRAITSSARPNGSWNYYGLVDAAAALTKGTDTVPPTGTGTSPAQNAKVRGDVAITPLGLKDDWSGIRAVDLYVDGKWHSWDYKAPFAPVLKTAGRNGAIKVQLRVYDKAGNSTWLPARTVIADNVLPTVSITKAPANKAKVKGTVKVYVKAADKSGISRVQLLVNGKVVATDTAAGYALSFKVASQKKTMKVRVRAYDKAGNVRYTTIRTYYRA
ncbi:S8 family serine peptidase [Actinoplanes hulinensis]|uniref:S8 family serine peptidase n=1 Tax=Actinoplanes hulinensis TaxID=1144547 RepID=A0ABS7AV38_9ACTN|nr:S8 family serine peptidase [Actinoplanes hulinensis]MBW6432590.1 S8 family serine peptidase [Actinoplanes hulinensis]